MKFRYELEPYNGRKSRHACPECGKRDVFALYIDTLTGEPLHDTVGRCNREANCGYHKKPGEYTQQERSAGQARKDVIGRRRNNRAVTAGLTRSPVTRVLKPDNAPSSDVASAKVDFISYDYFTPSLQGLESPNNFLTYLCSLFTRERVEKAFMNYYIGTSKHWPGATVFWQIDREANVRTGKVMLYDKETGHRVKEPFNHISWAHKLLDIKDFNLQQCFFGEHLITTQITRTVCIVESEKTAIIASIVFPYFIWLATGSLTNLSIGKCHILKRCKRIILFPDINGYSTWKRKSKELGLVNVYVSDILETAATPEQRAAGIDLADYLIDIYKPKLQSNDKN